MTHIWTAHYFVQEAIRFADNTTHPELLGFSLPRSLRRFVSRRLYGHDSFVHTLRNHLVDLFKQECAPPERHMWKYKGKLYY